LEQQTLNIQLVREFTNGDYGLSASVSYNKAFNRYSVAFYDTDAGEQLPQVFLSNVLYPALVAAKTFVNSEPVAGTTVTL
jgi:hypothetical protein